MVIFYVFAGIILFGLTIFVIVSISGFIANKSRNRTTPSVKKRTIHPRPGKPNEKW